MLYKLLDNIFLSADGDAAAIQNAEGQILTYPELRTKVQRISLFLKQNGIKAGGKLSCVLHQSDDLILIMLACFCSGVTYIPISPDEKPTKIQSILEECRPDLVITPTDFCESILASIKVEALDIQILFEKMGEIGIDSVYPSASMIKSYPSKTPIAIFYSSGTTGKPKGIPIKESGMCYWLKCLQQFPVEKNTVSQENTFHATAITESKVVAKHTMAMSGIKPDAYPRAMHDEPEPIPPIIDGSASSVAIKSANSQTRVLMYISPSFDAHVWEFLLTISRRGCCVIPKPETRTDIKALHEFISSSKITDILLLPPVLRSLIPEIKKASTTLQRLYSTGQELTETDVTDVSALGISLINCYGPTEATFGISMAVCDPKTCKNGKAAIAFPAKTGDPTLDGVEVILKPTPSGSRELYIVSPHLCRGYLNRKEQSQKSFVEIETEAGHKVRAFKTGDQFTSNGDYLYYEGRISSNAHLKINGQMIRLQDIEEKLRTYPYIQDVHVQSFDSEHTKEPVIYAYYTANQVQKNAILAEIRSISGDILLEADSISERETDLELDTIVDQKMAFSLASRIMPTISRNSFAGSDAITIASLVDKIYQYALSGDQLKQHLLKKSLYAPALPEIIKRLDAMPLTPNDKTNTVMLKQMALQHYKESRSKVAQLKSDDTVYTAMEQTIFDIWRSILPRINTQTEISRDISFQILGGSSLDFTRMLKEITKQFDAPIACSDFDDTEPVTIAVIAKKIYQKKTANSKNVGCLIKGQNTNTPIFLVHDITGNASATYQQLAKQLAIRFPGKSIYALDARAIDDPRMRCNDLHVVTSDYTASIQEIQPTGPYIIMGWSAGATLAYMINRQLEQEDKNVGFLGLIDGLSPRIYQSITPDNLLQEIEVLLKKLGAEIPANFKPPTRLMERKNKKGLVNWIFQSIATQFKGNEIYTSRLEVTQTFLTGLMSVVIQGHITSNQPHVFSTSETTNRLQKINPGMQNADSLGWLAETQPITTWQNIGVEHIDIITKNAKTFSSKVSQFFEQQQASGLTSTSSTPELTDDEKGITVGISVMLRSINPGLLQSLSYLLDKVPSEKQGPALKEALEEAKRSIKNA